MSCWPRESCPGKVGASQTSEVGRMYIKSRGCCTSLWSLLSQFRLERLVAQLYKTHFSRPSQDDTRPAPSRSAMTADKELGLRPSQSDQDAAPGTAVYTTTSGLLQTKRGLSPRHVQLMAIGGSIGVGLWVSKRTTSRHAERELALHQAGVLLTVAVRSSHRSVSVVFSARPDHCR